MTTFDCMTPEEYALWAENQVARARGRSICSDCPLWFELEERAAGRCCRDNTPARREQLREYSLRRRTRVQS